MSAIVDYYMKNGRDQSGRTWLATMVMSDEELEQVHDYIQWFFPTRQKSQFNPAAPVLTDEDVAIFRASKMAQDRMRAASKRMSRFYCLGHARLVWWAKPSNHNLLRITRILQSMCIFGLKSEATAMHKLFVQAAQKMLQPPTKSIELWDAALEAT